MEFEIAVVDEVPARATKYILHGTPIERGAAMTEPYSDRPDFRGAMDWSDDEIRRMARVAGKTWQPLPLHVSGDRPYATIIGAMKGTPADWPALRVRIEHGDFIHAFVEERDAGCGRAGAGGHCCTRAARPGLNSHRR